MSELTIQELRVEIDWFCGCGNPEDAAKTLLQILDMHPLWEHREDFDALVPGDGLQNLVLYMLDSVTERHDPFRWGWFEHGGNIGGQWLTEVGEAVRDGLRREKECDGFARLLPGGVCVHGWSEVDDGYEDHDCMAEDQP